MFDDCECEECGAPGTRTIRGVMLCEICDPSEEDDEAEPPHWLTEVPMGLLETFEDPCPESMTL